MDISCEVIKDLLPLYMEDMASEQSAKLVEDHLTACTACQKELEDMKAARVIPVQTDPHILHQVKASIIKRRFLTAFTAVMIVISVYLGFAEFMNADIYIPGEAAVARIEPTSNGGFKLYPKRYVNGHEATWDYNGNHGAYVASMRMKRYLFPADPMPEQENPVFSFGSEPEGAEGIDLSDYSFWYINIWDGTAGMPLWGTEGVAPPEDPIMEVNYSLFCVCGALLLLAVVLGVLSIRLYGKKKNIAQTASALCLSVFVGIILTGGGQLVLYLNSAIWRIRDSWIVALPVFVTVLCVLKLHRWKKQDEIL